MLYFKWLSLLLKIILKTAIILEFLRFCYDLYDVLDHLFRRLLKLYFPYSCHTNPELCYYPDYGTELEFRPVYHISKLSFEFRSGIFSFDAVLFRIRNGFWIWRFSTLNFKVSFFSLCLEILSDLFFLLSVNFEISFLWDCPKKGLGYMVCKYKKKWLGSLWQTCQVESLWFLILSSISPGNCIKIIEIHYNNGGSVKTTYRKININKEKSKIHSTTELSCFSTSTLFVGKSIPRLSLLKKRISFLLKNW